MEERDKGSLISVLTADIELLEVFYAHTISPIAIAILVSGIMTGFMFGIHPLTGVLALFAYLTVGVLVPLWNGKRTRGGGIKNREDMGGLSGYVLDSLRGLDVTLGFGYGETRRKNMEEKAESVAKDTEELAGLAGVQSAVTTFVILAFSFGMAFLASKYFGMFVEGTINTLYIAVVGTILGFVLGFAIGIIQDLDMSADDLPIVKALIKTLKLVTSAYVELFRNTPMIVQAMIVYYGLRQADVAGAFHGGKDRRRQLLQVLRELPRYRGHLLRPVLRLQQALPYR